MRSKRGGEKRRGMGKSSNLRMTSRRYEVETSMNTVIHQFATVYTVLLFQVGITSRFNAIEDRFPASKGKEWEGVSVSVGVNCTVLYLSSLLTKSPKPGVSTTVNRNFTPFSSISEVMDLTSTVWGDSWVSSTFSLGGYNWVLKSVLTKVDLPRPDSPIL